jgi:hypothetical protein
MKTELKRKDFVLAIIYAYLLVFVVFIPLSVGWADRSGLLAGLFFGAYSLIFGFPVLCITVLIGYPLFRRFVTRLNFGYFLNVLIACTGVAVIITLVAATGFVVVFGGNQQEFGAAVMILGIPTIIVALLTGVLFWLRTK